jgi:membrane protein
MTAFGLALATWSTTSAAASLMNGVGTAVGHRDGRGFVHRRLIALAIVACLVVAALLLVGLLVLGPHLAVWIGDAAGEPRLIERLWWTAQWPILLAALLFAFAVVLHLSPGADERRWRLVTPGAVVALVVWLAASVALAFYSARFGSFEKTWGTLSAVVVTLLWLWVGGAALLFGAEINAELERRDRVDG